MAVKSAGGSGTPGKNEAAGNGSPKRRGRPRKDDRVEVATVNNEESPGKQVATNGRAYRKRDATANETPKKRGRPPKGSAVRQVTAANEETPKRQVAAANEASRQGRPPKDNNSPAIAQAGSMEETPAKKRSCKNGLKSPTIGMAGVMTNTEENAALCEYALNMFHSKPVDLHDADAVAAAIDNYFRDCIERGLRPGNLGLYAALGMTKQNVNDAIRGQTKNIVSPDALDCIKKARTAMSTYREMLGSMGKINPVTLIFWQKNFDGLEDKQNVEVTPKQAEAQYTPEEVQEQLEDIPIDTDYKEL